MLIYKEKYKKPTLVAAAVLAVMTLSACNDSDNDTTAARSSSKPKNIILMISDGASWNTWEMGAEWQAGVTANALPAYADMEVRLGMTTYPLTTSSKPTNDVNGDGLSYDAAKAWDESAATVDESDSYQTAIAGYQYLKSNYTDSAAAGTALASGHKTYNNAINYDNLGQPLTYITQLAKQAGKATGVVTSVQLSHATPAAFSAQNLSRKNMTDIARDMLTNGNLDLLMGTGNPGYDGNGSDMSALSDDECAATYACYTPYDTIGETEWTALKAGELIPSGSSTPWTLIESKASFEALANGSLSVTGPLVGIPKVRWTLQQGREASVLGADASQPSGVKKIATVPDLPTLTQGALNYLGKNESGFFLMVEGGAVDWAAHANQADRMVEEQVDFNQALQAVEEWVAANSSWDETLLIVTTDHGNALPLGLDSDSVPYQSLTFNGAEALPAVRFWSGNHTNELVRLWARGQGSDEFNARVRGQDATFASTVGHNTVGNYVDNTDVFGVMQAALPSDE